MLSGADTTLSRRHERQKDIEVSVPLFTNSPQFILVETTAETQNLSYNGQHEINSLSNDIQMNVISYDSSVALIHTLLHTLTYGGSAFQTLGPATEKMPQTIFCE